jgi:PAS domain S-box-containing protein
MILSVNSPIFRLPSERIEAPTHRCASAHTEAAGRRSLAYRFRYSLVNAATLQTTASSAQGAAPPFAAAESDGSERRLRLAAEACADILVLVDRNLAIVFANRGANGRTSQQLCGLSAAELFPEPYRERALQCMKGVLQIGAPDRFEFEIMGPRGTQRHIEMRIAPVREQQQVVALTLNGSDTTQHVLAQRAVATQAKMIESMLEGVALINEAGLIVITNPAFDTLFGYSRGMLIGRPLASLADALDFSGLPRGASGTGPWPLEFEARRPDGQHVSVAGAISRLDDAERRHGLVVLQDVGERKNLERAILEAVSREQDRIGNDLHDGLGQELTGIALMLRCLAGRLQAEHGTAPPEIEGITRLLNQAVENTRSLARGLSPVHLERGGLRDALEGLAMHARGVYGINAAFMDKLPPDAQLSADVANHLYRIAQEAVTNAVKHGRAETVSLHLTAARGKVRLVVGDDGCGIPQASARTASPGMGLRIMRYRARMAHGDVRIENATPRGTRIVCECPLERSAAAGAERAEAHATAAAQARARAAKPRRAHTGAQASSTSSRSKSKQRSNKGART